MTTGAWRFLLLIAKIGLAVWLFWLLYDNQLIDLYMVQDLIWRGWPAAALLAATVLAAYRWWALLRTQQSDIPFGVALKVVYLSGFCSNILPGFIAGDVVRMVVLGSYYPKDFRNRAIDLGASVLIDRLVALVGALATTLLAAALLAPVVASSPMLASITLSTALLLGGLALITAVAILAGRVTAVSRLRKVMGARRWMSLLISIFTALISFRRHLTTMTLAVGLSLGTQLLGIIAIFSLAPDQIMTFLDAALATPLTLMVNMLPLTPGGIGVGEVAFQRLMEIITGQAYAFASIFVTYRIFAIIVHAPALFLIFDLNVPLFSRTKDLELGPKMPSDPSHEA